MTDDKVKYILNSFFELEKDLYYKDSSCNLYSTAKKLDTNQTYLSRIVNHYLHRSFREYINELRIQYLLKTYHSDRKLRCYTVKAIGLELGFKSCNTFKKAFKKYANTEFSEYKKILVELDQK
ncbi:helix-turn-helix domain-containing protein [Aquimarina litoralis]|uniref:helix-turn-helix domain-containing protein n=1 Tax=Aquimarina litoralis TaxID=584605 RepID=UPI001C564AFF|nr:helix-turn-helix domain-containing protein [Aquimarina litoralis]MBW1298471.1 helix-turn-helix domain-containing protein [Aquimarina litoralis]